MKFKTLSLVIVVASLTLPCLAQQQTDNRTSITELIAKQLELSGNNRGQLQAALDLSAPTERQAMEFLLAYMPERDLTSLSSEFLLDNVRQALAVRTETEWQKTVPDAVFFNDVLPYAAIDESRDAWRAEFREKFWPLVKDCKSGSDVAQKLNEAVFKEINVKYSTQRKRASQSPKESIEQGIASCSGLSIILVDACRSVGVPARVAGIPKWANKDGNHTWVEIWDGDWHFTGAAEYDANGLDRAWFNADAALADKSSLYSSIYAVSYQPTGDFFPLVWARDDRTFHAVNVTERYTKDKPKTAKTETVRVLVTTKSTTSKKRIARALEVWPSEKPDERQSGMSADESRDLNDILSFELQRNTNYVVQDVDPDYPRSFVITTPDAAQQMLEFWMDESTVTVPNKLDSTGRETSTAIEKLTKSYFEASPEERSTIKFDPKVVVELSGDTSAIRAGIWAVFREGPLTEQLKSDFDANQAVNGEHVSPYTIKTVGNLPAGSKKWPLFIAMHGGGNASAEVNDSQWKVMQRYYKDQPDLGGYKYIALRAPNNSWNGFYDNYVYPLIENLIAQQIAFGDIDPNRVYIMGYSHGGYGAFAIGPKMPDRFAAIHASASAPTDGETIATNLRTTRFTFMIGENDTAYGRRERCEAFAKKIAELRRDRQDIYPVEMFYKAGYGHGGLPDRDMIRAMLPFRRNPVPREITWEMTDPVVDNLFWLSVEAPAKGQSVDARILPGSNSVPMIELETVHVDQITVWLDERLTGAATEIDIKLNGQVARHQLNPSIRNLCDSLLRRSDPELAFKCRVDLNIPKQE